MVRHGLQAGEGTTASLASSAHAPPIHRRRPCGGTVHLVNQHAVIRRSRCRGRSHRGFCARRELRRRRQRARSKHERPGRSPRRAGPRRRRPYRHRPLGRLFDTKGNLVAPEVPARTDVAGLCAWLTLMFNLDPAHPITGGRRQGAAGPEGHVALTRADAPEIRFEPVTRTNTPAKLIERCAGT